MPVEKALKVLEQVKKRLLLFNAQPEFRIQMGTGDGSENVVFYLTENIFALSRNSPDYDGEIFRIVEKTLGGPTQTRAVVDFYQQNRIPCFGAVGALDVAVANQGTPIHGSIQLIWIIESSQDLTAIDRCVVLGIGRAVGLLGAIYSDTPSIFNPSFMPETPTQQDLWLIRQMLRHRWFDVTLDGIRRKIYADPILN